MSIKNKISYRNIPVKGYMLFLWNRLISEARYRMSGSISFSVIIHLLLLLGYFSLSALDQPVEPPIREISFIDLTEIEKKPEDIFKQKESQPPPKRVVAQTQAQEKNDDAKSSSSAALALGKDKIFMDSPRKQAPINMKQYEPVADNVKDILNVSPAIGVKKDDRIAKPQALDLGKNPKVLIASTSPASGALAFGNSGNSQIDLEPGTISGGSVEAVSGDLGTAAAESNRQESLLKPRETQTVITGVLANREILKKVIPPFPRWAKMQGVGATISLQFTVMENGSVKENVIIVRTSGSLQWDRMVIASLKNWQFVALPQKDVREDQTGVITFKFEI